VSVAIHAIGEHYLGEQRAAMAAFTFGLLVTFLAVRINTRLIRANVKWWFHDMSPRADCTCTTWSSGSS
jgi:hypothetical protein